MPIHVVVAEAGPLLSEGLVLSLREDPDLSACAAAGTPLEALEECRRRRHCVLVAGESVLEGIPPRRFRELADYGRAVPVLVLGLDPAPDRALSWLRLGSMGYLSRCDGADEIARAIRAVAAGQMWGRRSDLAVLLRELLAPPARGPRLTVREREILDLMSAGAGHAEMADRLFISVDTVRWHLRRLSAKAGGQLRLPTLSRVAAVAKNPLASRVHTI